VLEMDGETVKVTTTSISHSQISGSELIEEEHDLELGSHHVILSDLESIDLGPPLGNSQERRERVEEMSQEMEDWEDIFEDVPLDDGGRERVDDTLSQMTEVLDDTRDLVEDLDTEERTPPNLVPTREESLRNSVRESVAERLDTNKVKWTGLGTLLAGIAIAIAGLATLPAGVALLGVGIIFGGMGAALLKASARSLVDESSFLSQEAKSLCSQAHDFAQKTSGLLGPSERLAEKARTATGSRKDKLVESLESNAKTAYIASSEAGMRTNHARARLEVMKDILTQLGHRVSEATQKRDEARTKLDEGRRDGVSQEVLQLAEKELARTEKDLQTLTGFQKQAEGEVNHLQGVIDLAAQAENEARAAAVKIYNLWITAKGDGTKVQSFDELKRLYVDLNPDTGERMELRRSGRIMDFLNDNTLSKNLGDKHKQTVRDLMLRDPQIVLAFLMHQGDPEKLKEVLGKEMLPILDRTHVKESDLDREARESLVSAGEEEGLTTAMLDEALAEGILTLHHLAQLRSGSEVHLKAAISSLQNGLEFKAWQRETRGTSDGVASHMGVKPQRSNGDGDCFFWSVGRTLEHGSPKEVREALDKEVREFVQRYRNDELTDRDRLIIEQWGVSGDHETTEERIEELARLQEGGFLRDVFSQSGDGNEDRRGSLDLVPFIAKIYGRPVVVIQREEGTDKIRSNPALYDDQGKGVHSLNVDDDFDDDAMVLIFNGKNHWDGASPVES